MPTRRLRAAALLLVFACGACGGARQQQQQQQQAAATPAATPAVGETAARELPPQGFRAQLTVADPPARLRAGQKETIVVRVRNASDVAWPAPDFVSSKYVVAVGDNWLDASGQTVGAEPYMDGRYGIQSGLGPGEEVELPLVVTAPARPGEYQLELDMVQEQVAWFREKGSQPLRLKVRVE
jgi:hypothetical protein